MSRPPLTHPEARVLGALIEKHLATPNLYPLTMSALVGACNQTSNREPVTSFTEGEVAAAVADLREKRMIRVVHGSGQRTEKYRHVLDEQWGLDDQHLAVLAVMLLRGPQTVGELRARTERLATFDSLADIEEVLGLLDRREEPLACRLDRAPGQKEARWTELLHAPDAVLAGPEEAPAAPTDERIDVLERDVADLRAAVAALQEALARLSPLLE